MTILNIADNAIYTLFFDWSLGKRLALTCRQDHIEDSTTLMIVVKNDRRLYPHHHLTTRQWATKRNQGRFATVSTRYPKIHESKFDIIRLRRETTKHRWKHALVLVAT